MSVILDALHKARGDKRKLDSEPHAGTVAKVLDAGAAPVTPSSGIATQKPKSDRSERGVMAWLVVTSVIFGGLCLLLLIGGAFFLLYNQIQRLEVRSSQVSMEQVQPMMAGTEPLPAAVLPTPLPLSDLPIQPPAASGAVTSPGAAPVRPDFSLGSIVCENDDCLASLNNRTVRSGDEIQGYRVTEITPTMVLLKSVTGNDEVTLSLY